MCGRNRNQQFIRSSLSFVRKFLGKEEAARPGRTTKVFRAQKSRIRCACGFKNKSPKWQMEVSNCTSFFHPRAVEGLRGKNAPKETTHEKKYRRIEVYLQRRTFNSFL
eukprot:3646693-Rhodomonas_salina.1